MPGFKFTLKKNERPDDRLVWNEQGKVQCQRCGEWVRHVSQSYVDGLYWCDPCGLEHDPYMNKLQVARYRRRVEEDARADRRAAQARRNFHRGEEVTL